MSYVSRINQLDAAQLDHEIYRILSGQIQDISRLFTPGITEPWTPEINAVLRSLIWMFSLNKNKASFGQKLLALTYTDLTRKKVILLLLLSVLPKYLEDKYLDPNKIIMTKRGKLIQKYLEIIANIMSLLSLLNLLIFLKRGNQPSILEIIIGITSYNVATHKPRTIGYSYMTRELLWHGFTELFTIGLPMINFHCIKQYILRFWPKKKHNLKLSTIPRMEINSLCPYCEETPVLPRHAGCSHVYCYYCIQSHFTAMESFNCMACGLELHKQNVQIYTPPNST